MARSMGRDPGAIGVLDPLDTSGGTVLQTARRPGQALEAPFQVSSRGFPSMRVYYDRDADVNLIKGKKVDRKSTRLNSSHT